MNKNKSKKGLSRSAFLQRMQGALNAIGIFQKTDQELLEKYRHNFKNRKTFLLIIMSTIAGTIGIYNTESDAIKGGSLTISQNFSVYIKSMVSGRSDTVSTTRTMYYQVLNDVKTKFGYMAVVALIVFDKADFTDPPAKRKRDEIEAPATNSTE